MHPAARTFPRPAPYTQPACHRCPACDEPLLPKPPALLSALSVGFMIGCLCFASFVAGGARESMRDVPAYYPPLPLPTASPTPANPHTATQL